MDQEKIIKLAMNKSVEEINEMYRKYNDQHEVLVEAIRQNLSRTLMDTNENDKIACCVVIECGAMGISDAEKTTIVSAWQEPAEGTIWFNIYGCDEEINLDDIELEDQIRILNGIFKRIIFVNDRHDTQRGIQLSDGRIISMFNKNNEFYIRFDDVIDLTNGVIIRHDGKDLTEDDIAKGYTTFNRLIADKKAKEVYCYDELDFNMPIYSNDPNIDKIANADEICEYFHNNGYNVTAEAVKWCVENWKSGFKSGYRDEKNGYHLFNPCGRNQLSIRLTTLHPLCEDWQTTYWC